MKILAIDYGVKRVGVAVSYASLAQPLEVLENDEQLMARLRLLIEQHRVQAIVVGISENVMAERTQEFVRRLRAVTPLPVTLIDETLSSHQVHEWLRQAPARKRRGPIDHLAAAVILERYLEGVETRE